MKNNLILNYSDTKKASKPLNKVSYKNISIESLSNKLLNEMIESYIKNKGNMNLSIKNYHILFNKKAKSPKFLSNSVSKRISSAKINKNKNSTPKTNVNSIEINNRRMKEKISFKHKNFSAININDNSYNFHDKAPKTIINQDKKLLIYVNKNDDKSKEDNEDEKCNITPRYFIQEYRQQKENINKFPLSQTSNHFPLNSQRPNHEPFQKNKLLETPIKSDEKNIPSFLSHSKSVKNTHGSLLEKKNRDLEKLTSSIKEEVKNYFVKHRFSSVKDYFNDWLYYKRKKDYQKRTYLDEDCIYYYLKEKLGIKIYKNEIQKIFKCNKGSFDINNFKNFFFEENSGKKFLLINDYLLLKQTLFNSYKKFNKNKNLVYSSFSDIIKNSKDKMPNFKNNLLMSVLKEHKSKIVDKICDNFILNNKKNEYDYFEFYNLFKNLNLDKKIVNKKIIKRVFNKYKKENDKVDIKYFIYNLYKKDIVKNELFCEKEEDKKNMIDSSKHIQNYYNSKPINLHLNKIEFPYKTKSKNATQLIQKEEKNNKPSPLIEIERYKYKSKTPCFKKDMNFNRKIDNYSHINKFKKFSESKIMKKLKKKKFFTLYDTSLKNSNLSSIIKTNKQKNLDINSYKTIRIRKKYQANTINNITTKTSNDNNTKKSNKLDRPISAYSKCLLGINNNKYKSYSNFFDNDNRIMVSEDTRMQNINSDIINLI